MARCSFCNMTILFGGVRDGEFRYCNDKCRAEDDFREMIQRLPPEIVAEHARQLHAGPCPKCGGAGPVDIHVAHSVWSALVVTSRRSQPDVSCRSCGVKRQLGATVSSALFGWWGFPWGLVFTPIQIVRNVTGMVKGPNPFEPSPELHGVVGRSIAIRIAQGANRAASKPET